MKELIECIKNLLYAVVHGSEEDCRQLGSKVGEVISNILK